MSQYLILTPSVQKNFNQKYESGILDLWTCPKTPIEKSNVMLLLDVVTLFVAGQRQPSKNKNYKPHIKYPITSQIMSSLLRSIAIKEIQFNHAEQSDLSSANGSSVSSGKSSSNGVGSGATAMLDKPPPKSFQSMLCDCFYIISSNLQRCQHNPKATLFKPMPDLSNLTDEAREKWHNKVISNLSFLCSECIRMNIVDEAFFILRLPLSLIAHVKQIATRFPLTKKNNTHAKAIPYRFVSKTNSNWI